MGVYRATRDATASVLAPLRSFHVPASLSRSRQTTRSQINGETRSSSATRKTEAAVLDPARSVRRFAVIECWLDVEAQLIRCRQLNFKVCNRFGRYEIY